MALPYVCPRIKAKPFQGPNGWNVVAVGEIIAQFERYSPAKTFAKRWNSMFRWLGQSNQVYPSDFAVAVSATLARAGSGDGSYRPPLTLV